MKKIITTIPLFLICFSAFSQTEVTVLKISKTINPKNVLHYKIKYDEETCEIKGKVFADWKMDEEDGRWKSLNESSGMIKGPLDPKTLSVSFYEADFFTESMGGGQEKGILNSRNVRVISEQERSGRCKITNQVDLGGQMVHVDELHSKVSMFGSVKWVEITGNDSKGRAFKKRISN